MLVCLVSTFKHDFVIVQKNTTLFMFRPLRNLSELRNLSMKVCYTFLRYMKIHIHRTSIP